LYTIESYWTGADHRKVRSIYLLITATTTPGTATATATATTKPDIILFLAVLFGSYPSQL
jgi:hypothetical protein